MTKGVKIKCKLNCLVIQIYHISVLCLRILFHTFTRLSSLIAIIAIKYILIIKTTRRRLRNEAKWTLPDDIWTLSSILIFTWKHFFSSILVHCLILISFFQKRKNENKWQVVSLLGLPWIVGLHHFNPLLLCLKYETRKKMAANQQFHIRPARVWLKCKLNTSLSYKQDTVEPPWQVSLLSKVTKSWSHANYIEV